MKNEELLPQESKIRRIIETHIPKEHARLVFTWVDEQEKRIKRKELDFTTILEIATQISEKSLDPEKIESYAISTVKGQVGVSRAFLMRQDDFNNSRIVSSPVRFMNTPKMDFDVDGPFGSMLRRIAEPFLLRDEHVTLPQIAEIQILRNFGVEMCVPLVKAEKEEGNTLQGLLCLGRKMSGVDFTEADKKFMALLGKMLAISLHNAQLYQRSIIDGLTRVYSRGHFELHLMQEICRAERYASADKGVNLEFVSLLMLDIDNFKAVNDTYGHQVGDFVLKKVADILQAGTRRSDVIARYGGEEFALIFPATAKENAVRLAERLRRRIMETAFKVEEGPEVRITVSFGVATYPTDALGMRELIRKADMALYEAKRHGRNRVVTAQ